MANFLNQNTTVIGLPAGCVGHDFHFTGYRETNIIVLGKRSNHHICLRFRYGWGEDIPDSASLERKSLQHKSTRWCCEILGKWTMVVSSKTWAGSATHMWTRCPRQAWPHSSLIIKHYRVQAGNHNRGYQSLHAWKSKEFTLEQTPLSWANQSVAWGARKYMWNGGS